ncbi:A-kinase anchor protein 12-like isoform X2 [Clinocottus analis]|uniref:A-kinase anchor protein 12-like isoform X2 n=1 Tax=Clinocottus analis TaxID=304258 RepID=UPI0035C0A571
MEFPVDFLSGVSQAQLERSGHDFMNKLLYSDPDRAEQLGLANGTKVTIDVSSVGFVPLFGSASKQKILALFSPGDLLTAAALYLLDRWWTADDILKTADPTRGGAVQVQTVGERIVLYILNRVVYRAREMSPDELPFLCHGERDHAKILWVDGEAVGFYSVKPSGSFLSSYATRSYQLPVMDSIFVRKRQRGKGFGLQMLEDFVLSSKEDRLGLRYPVTQFMYKVCERYLRQYPGDTDLLWEVESTGGPNQRTNIARKIRAMDQMSRSLTFTEESLVITERTKKDVTTNAISSQIKEAGALECTVEIVEEVTVLRVAKVSEAEVPLTARGRSSGSKRRKMEEKIGEDKSEKVIRIEDIEAEDQVSAQQKTELHVSEVGISSVAPEEQGEDLVDSAPEEEAARMLDQPDTILAQQGLEEADVALAPTTEAPQVEDGASQNPNGVSCDSQITVENVASEIEEERREEDAAAPAVSEEASEEAETPEEVGEGNHVGVTDDESEEPSLSTRVTSENGEAVKTGIVSVEAVTTVQSMTPGRRYTRHSAVTVTVTMEDKRCAVSEICADRDADAHGNLPLAAEVDEPMSYEEEEALVVETKTPRRKTKTSTAAPRRTSTRGRKQTDAHQEAENSEEEPAVTTRMLRRGRTSTADTPKGKSRRSRKQIQEKGEEESKRGVEDDAAEEAAAGKTDEEMVDTVKETASEKEEGGELKMDEEEEEVEEQKQDAVEVITGLASDPPTEGDEGGTPEDEMEAENEDLVPAEVESEEGTMTLTLEEEDSAGVTAAADDLVQGETDAPLPSPPTDSAEPPPAEEEATPSAEEQQSEDVATQLSDHRRVTVVLVDLQKTHQDVQEEAAATEEGLPVQRTAAEAEEEPNKIQDPVEGRDEETAEEEEAKSVVEEQKPVVTETPTSGKQAVEATPRPRGRPRKGQGRKEADIQTEEPEVQVRTLRTGRKSLPVAQRSTRKRTRKQLQEEEEEEEEVGEESTAVEASEEEEEQQIMDQEKEESPEERDATEQVENIEAEMALEEEDTVAEEGQDAMEDQSEGISQTSAERQVDALGGEYDALNTSLGAEKVDLPPVVATRSLRSGGKTSKDPPKTRSKQSKKQSDEEEEEEEEPEPQVVTIIHKRGRKSVRKSHKQLQKTEEGPEESVEEEEVQEEDNAGQGLSEGPPTEGDEGGTPEDEMEAENEDLVPAEVESEEETMTLTLEEEDSAGVTAAADDLVQGETDAPLPSPPTDYAEPPPAEEEATPSAEEQQSEDVATQLSDHRRVTVVLVDLQKTHQDVQEEAAATEEGLPVQRTAAEAEEEPNKIQDPVEGRDEETAEEEEAKSVVEEQKPVVTETPTSGKQAVEATPRPRGRPRKGQGRKEADIQTEEPEVQVRTLRTGRKSLPVAQRSTRKRTRKQLQEEEEEEEVGEESTAVEASEEEEEQQIMDQEKEDSPEERDATEQAENIEAEMALEEEDTVAEEAVNQQDAQEEGQVDGTETVADEDTEASVEHHNHEENEEKIFVFAKEAVAKRDTVEGEESTSTSEVVESLQETAKEAIDASEEEAPVVERVLRSGGKTVKATTRSKTTKKPEDEQEEESPGEKSTEEDEPEVEIRAPRKGRKPAEASPRRKSKRARTQCPTEEEEEEEPTPTDEIEGEEEEAGQESPEEKGIEVEEVEKEEEAHNAAGEESTVEDAEQTKDALTAEAGVLEEGDSVDAVFGSGTDTDPPSSVEVEEANSAVEEETAVAEVGSDAAIDEEEDAPAATTRALRSKRRTSSPATPSLRSRGQKDDSPRRSVRKRPKVDYRENNEGAQDEAEGNTDEEKEVPVASAEDQGTKTSDGSSKADEAVEAAGSSQEDEEYELNTSEEEEEPIVIGKRVLRGRSIPSFVITPRSTPRRRSAKAPKEETSPRSARKRKGAEVTRKSKRLSRV